MAGRLSLASIVAAAALALLATPALATDLDRDCTRETVGRVPGAAARLAALDEIFVEAVEPVDGLLEGMHTREVVLARIIDGKLVMACVDTKEAAEKFLAATPEQLRATRAEEK
jgi:hypothetical protein